jgi:ribosomal protein L16 Arg81 hydroxylase
MAGTAISDDLTVATAFSTQSTQPAPRTLAEVLAPLSTEEFLQRYWGKSYHHVPGRAGKFASLLPWSDLNQLLTLHQLDAPRLRLVRDGKPLPAESFLSYHANRRNPSSRLTRLRSVELTRQLQEGATLILDAVDELQEHVADLAEQLERSLRTRVQVNLYAGWRTSPGFDVHWDGHDVLILQIHGRKLWKVYPMTREHPIQGDPKDEKPPQEPLWEGMLESGDLLYIPRGWWHVAVPVDEPTLHLTVGLHRPTGLDFVSWYAERLRSQAVIRENLPAIGTESEKAAHLHRLREAWEQSWAPGLLDEFCDYLDSQARSRPQLGLPWTAQASVLPSSDVAWSLRWLVPHQIGTGNPGTVIVRGNGKEWTFAAEARSVLEKLQTNGACTREELEESAASALTPEQLRLFLQELVQAGLACVVVNERQ